MKIANFSKLLLVAVVLSVGMTACKKTPKSPTPIYGKAAPVPNDNTKPNGPMEPSVPPVPADTGPKANPLANSASGTELTGRGRLDDYLQDREAFKQDTVYFDFDRYNVKPAELSKVQAVADFLKGQASDAVLVEGHCDERGTPEYNRALGERRAISIRESLTNLGIAADRIHTISYGEDKPVDTGHNEAAWAKNRRGEFILLKPKSGGGSAEAR